MKKLIMIALVSVWGFANESVFVDEPTGATTQEPQQTITELINLNALQDSFFQGKNGNDNNILNIQFEPNNTYRVRTRYAMTTLIVLHHDKIAFSSIGDETSFDVKTLGVAKYDLSNMLMVKPLQIGVDTSLTIVGESGNIYSFYLFSTDHTNNNHPNLVVFVSEESERIERLKIRNLEKEAFEKAAQAEREAKALLEQKKNDETKYLTIGEGINTLKIDRREIRRNFEQKGADTLIADDIFRDDKFTYFKYDASDAFRKFPVVYRVVDGYDNPVNSRVVGDYIIAETVADKFTLRLGEEYVCVRLKEQKR